MRINIFKIPKEQVPNLKEKFSSLNLSAIKSGENGEYESIFYFSKEPHPINIPWADTYKDFFIEIDEEIPTNKIYFSCYLWENDKFCFALSYGKAHFYLRRFCELEFGTHLAKRIAQEEDIRQKSSRKFAGRKKKEIKSYTKNSRLDIESGESIDYLQAAIIESQEDAFGASGKFGSSALLNPEIEKEDLPDFFDRLILALDLKEQFQLPRTTNIDNTDLSKGCELKLVKDILSSDGSSDFTSSSHDLVGVDFIFSGQEKYRFRWRGVESSKMDDLSIEKLRKFVIDNSIDESEILSIRVDIEKEDVSTTSFSRTIKESLDYIVEGQNIILSQGSWMQFNEDYLYQLDQAIDEIELEETEQELQEITEPDEGIFNKSLSCSGLGYKNTDKDFSIIKVPTGVLVEAWDLEKGDTVYAVKFGTPQKLGYVFDQANSTIELIKKKANIKKLKGDFKNYCIWIRLNNKEKIGKLSEIKSIIFKQKAESWARKCYDFKIIPKFKISYKG